MASNDPRNLELTRLGVQAVRAMLDPFPPGIGGLGAVQLVQASAKVSDREFAAAIAGFACVLAIDLASAKGTTVVALLQNYASLGGVSGVVPSV